MYLCTLVHAVTMIKGRGLEKARKDTREGLEGSKGND